MTASENDKKHNSQNASAPNDGIEKKQENPQEESNDVKNEEINTEENDISELIEENNEEAGLEELQNSLHAANDRYLRLMAEFDNYRRRTAKEQLNIIETANAKLLEKLSEVLDNFERAALPENRGNDIEAFAKGMDLIHDQFKKTLEDAGLEQINPYGEPFDPSCQEALMKQASDKYDENTVIEVFQKGYKLKNKIIKTAKVIVSAGKE